MSVAMKALKMFTIQFVGLKEEKHHFEYKIDNTFFQHFEYNEFNKVNVVTNLMLDKKTTFLELFFNVEGSVNVNCDVTNEPYDQPIDGEFKLVVKFGNELNEDNEDILIVPHGEYEINVAQYIYELIILSIPAKRIHPGVEDGSLKSDILNKLEELSLKSETKNIKTEEIDPRWNTLKKLLTDK
jgi:uncharacterized metal-binding protein YceD (DUF177 family)